MSARDTARTTAGATTVRTSFRTLLFTPGDRPDRLAKAMNLDTDGVILDLEDAVHTDAKVAARAGIAEVATWPRRPGLVLLVRVNALSTPFAEGDLDAVAVPGVGGIVLPMVSGPADLAEADRRLTGAERRAGLPDRSLAVVPILETAAGVTSLSSYAEAPPRVLQFAFGAGDLALDLGVPWVSDNPALLHAKAQLPLWSRTLGLAKPLDSAYPQVRDSAGFEAESRHAAGLGYGGKMCIHPDQLGPANRVFSPSAEELAWARRVVDGFADAEKRGLAAVTVDGEFVDYPVVYRARQLLEVPGAGSDHG